MQGLVQAAAGFEHRGQEVTGPELGDRQVEFPTRARSGWGCRRVCTTPGDASCSSLALKRAQAGAAQPGPEGPVRDTFRPQDLTRHRNLVYMVDQRTYLFMASNQGADRRAVLNFEGKRYDLSSMPDEMKRLVKGLQTAEGQLKFAQDQLRVIAVGRQVLASQLKRKLSEVEPISE